MDFKSLELPNINLPISDVVYDPIDKTLVLANNSNISNYDIISKNNSAHTQWNLPIPHPSAPISKESQNSKPKNQSFRFSPSNSQPKLIISPSGLLVTCVSIHEELAVADVGFESGVHYWEIICPKHCKNVHIGVIREGWSLTNLALNAPLLQAQTFKTSTPRVVGLRLDLNKGELNYWLNGNFQLQRTLKNIPSGKWYPCVKLKENGTHIVLNPFARDPDAIYPIYNPKTKQSVSQIKCALPQYIFIGGFQKLTKETTKFEEIFTFSSGTETFQPVETKIDETGTMAALRFQNAADVESFRTANQGKKHNGETLHILDNWALLSVILEANKTGKDFSALLADAIPQDNVKKIVMWVKRNLSSFCKYADADGTEEIAALQELYSKVAQKLTDSVNSRKQVSQESSSEEGLVMKFIQKSGTLLVAQGNMIKLFQKENGRFLIKTGTLQNKPRNPRDEVYLSIPKVAIAIILSELDLKNNAAKLFTNKSRFTAFREFLSALETGLDSSSSSSNPDVTIKIAYKYAKNFVDGLLNALVSSLKWLKSLIREATDFAQNKPPVKRAQLDPYTDTNELPLLETTNGDPVASEQRFEELSKKEKYIFLFKHLNAEQIYFMLQILLNLDETLYAMTLHETVSPKIQKYWPNKQPRLFTAFARLGSFLTYPSNKFSIVQLAEAGLYNTQDILYDIRHFIDPTKRVEELHNIKENEELWSLLQKSLPNNRMIQGLTSENVPLHVTLNNIPPQQHSSESQNKVIDIATNQRTSLISTISGNGEVKIWNTEVALVCLAHANFRQKGMDEKAMQAKKDDIEDNFLAGLDLEETKPADVVADAGMAEALYNMGFALEVAKKALVLTKNSGIAAAVEKILTLQEEDKTVAPIKPVVTTTTTTTTTTTSTTSSKYNTTKIKKMWNCPACTFVNTNQNKLCEICGWQAPPDAYYNEEELGAEAEPEPKPTEKPVEEIVTKPIKAPEVQQKFLDVARIAGNMIIPLESSPLSPVVVGVMFEDQNKYQLRLRRYIYSNTYIKRFIRLDPARGNTSLISGAWFNQDKRDAYNHLLSEYGLTFGALEPIFMGNLRYIDVKKEAKNSLFCGDLVQCSEQDYIIDNAPGRLAGMATINTSKDSNREVNTVLMLWEKDSKYILQQVDVQADYIDPSMQLEEVKVPLKIEEGARCDIPITGKVLLFEINCDNNLVITTTEKVFVYNPNKLEGPQSTHPFSGKPTKAKLFGSQAIGLVMEDRSLKIVELQDETIFSQSESTNHSSSPVKSRNVDVNELDEETIDAIRAVLHKKPLEGIVNQQGQVVRSGNEGVNKKSTKFYLPLDKNGINGSTLEVSFLQPTSLINLELSINFCNEQRTKPTTLDSERILVKNLIDKFGNQDKISKKTSFQAEDVAGEDVENKDSKLPILTITESDSGSKFLPLTVYSFTGAAFNESFPVSKLIFPNNEVFSTNYANSEFVFEHLHGKTMLVKSITVHSKFKPIGSCGFPIGSGLIFTANHLSHLDMSSKFHHMKHEQFLEWFKVRTREGREFEPWEPVGSFQFDAQNETATVELLFVRPCKYILMKPTSMRSKPENYSHLFDSNPLEIKFFGASGAVVDDTAVTPKHFSKKSLATATGSEVTLEAQTQEQEWISIQTLSDIQVQNIIDKNNAMIFKSSETVSSFSDIPLWGNSAIEITNEVLFQKKITKLRLKVTNKDNSESNNWVISGAGIQAFASSQITCHVNLPFSPATFRKLMLNTQEFEKFNKSLVLEISKEDISQQKRKKITDLISEIISSEPSLVTAFYQHFDIKSFLLYSVLKERNSTFLEIQNLLRHFSSQSAFAETLLNTILELLPQLKDVSSVSYVGLNGFFSLLTWCQSLSREKVFNTVLQELHTLASRISQVRAPEYNLLRTQYNIPSLVFEKELCSDASLSFRQSKKKKSKDDQDKAKGVEPLKSKFLAFHSNDVDEYIVDLGQKCKLREVKLTFEQNNKLIKFRVQIWALDGDDCSQKKLVHSKFYNESTWMQLTNYAYDRTNKENNYKPSEQLECLGFSNLNISARYVLIQITYALVPIIQNLTEKNDKKIIPEIYGEPLLNQPAESMKLQGLFSIKNIPTKDSVKVGHSAKYERFDVTGKVSTFKYIYDSTGTLGKGANNEEEAVALEDSEENNLEKLKNLQADLSLKLATFSTEDRNTQNKDVVNELCEEIESVQRKLLDIQAKRDTPSVKNPSSSLDYLYTLATRLSQAIRRLDTNTDDTQRPWRKDSNLKGQQGRTIAYNIFEKLIAYEINPINSEFISLLSEVLVNNLTENEWQSLSISIVNNFLSKHIHIYNSPVNTIFSHSRIIEALQKITVPTNELLIYLLKKLNIPLKLTNLQDQKSKQEKTEDSTVVFTLSSVLLLLNDGYKKSQNETGEIAPPDMKRSVSKDASGKSKDDETKKLTYEESLQAALNICVWICENTSLNNTDKTNLLTIGLDLVLQLIKFCKATGIKEILKNPNSFLKLFISTMRLGSASILAKFNALINAFLNPKANLKSKKAAAAQETSAEDEAVAEQTRILLVCHLQTILKCLIDYVLQPDAASYYFNISKEDLPASVWLENLCFILEFLLLTAEKLNIDPNKENKEIKKKPSERKRSVMITNEDLRNRIADNNDIDLYRFNAARGNRSLSLNLDLRPKEFNAENFDKSVAIPLELVSQLILLLSPKENQSGNVEFNFSTSTKAWSLVMKALLKVKVTILVEAQIFDNLISSFLEANDDIQQIMFPEIIELTQSMLKHQNYQKELCNAVLQVIFNTLNSFKSDSFEPIAFSLLKGWLDILLTTSSPKPEEYYTKPPERAFCKLNAQGAFTLFVNLAKYLWSNLNLGSKDGVQNCSELNIVKLQIANDLLRLLITSESTSSLLAIGELFSNFKKYSKDIKKALEYYLEWFLINRATDSSPSPSTDLMLSISESMMKLFQIIPDYQEVTKVAIAALINGCKKMDQTLLKLLPSQQISSYTTIQYNNRQCKILEELFDMWVTSDTIASLVAFEVRGFEYLLDRMGLTSSQGSGLQSPESSSTAPSMLEGTDLLDHLNKFREEAKLDSSASKPASTDNNVNTEDPKEEEFANKLTIINQPGQAWSGITPDWSINKKGIKARILFFVMNGNFYNEYCLVFNLEKQIELKQIKVGFNCVWSDYNDKVLGIPSSVLVEGGTSVNNFTPIATLEPINDEGYTNFSVKCFHKNFQTITGSSDKNLQTSIESLASKKVSYLKFRFRRPIVTFVEGLSMLSSKNTKTVAVSISFISVNGFDATKLPNTRKKVIEAQENSALQVISKLCNEQFTETLGTLANETDIINKVKSSFDNLARLLVTHESWLSPVFKAIATHNDKMGDWIMSKFLDLNRSREHAKLVGEIILTNNAFAFDRLKRLHQFVTSELKRILSLSKIESMNKFSALVPFIETLCTTMRSIPLDLLQQQIQVQKTQALEFEKQDVDIIIQAFENFNASTNNKVLVKLILLYLYIPAPFTTTGEGLVKYALEKLWDATFKEKKTLYYEMLGPLVIGSNTSAKWFANNLDSVLNDLYEKLQEINNQKNVKTFTHLRHTFILLNNISRNDHLKRKVSSNGWHLKLYEALKNKDEKAKTVLKEIDSDILQLAVDFLKNISVGYPQVEEQLSKAFIADLSLLETKRDLFFVNNLLVPLLNAEADVPVCLHPYDPQSKRTITDTRHLPTLSTSVVPVDTLKSTLLSKERTETLTKTIQKVSNQTGLSRKIKNLPWELAITTHNDSENILGDIRQKLSKQGPFLIIMEGVSAGKKCFIGVFCSQSMAELPEQFDPSFDQTYPIPMADDNFIFYYDDNLALHFPIPSFPNQTDFAQVHSFYDGGGGISFYYNNSEKIFISFASTQTTYAEISQDVKPMDDETTQTYPADLVSEFVFKAAEFWVLKPTVAGQQSQKDKKNKSNTLSNVLFPAWHNANSPLNYFRASPVYTVPSSLTIEKLVSIMLNSDIPVLSTLTREELDSKTTLADLYEFFSNDASTNNIIDVEFDVLQLLERQNQKKENENAVVAVQGESLKYKPAMTLFEAFEKNGGVKGIIDITLKSLNNWKDKEKSKRWHTWLQELSTFSALPNFFGLFLKNKECIELLFQILAGIPDEEKDPKYAKKWEEEELKAVRSSYQILADVFAVDNDVKLREFAIEQNFFSRILDRISLISKESKRSWIDDIKKEDEESSDKGSPDKSGTKKAETEEDYKKKAIKKKGIGYASDNTGQNQRWNVNEYVESKKARNEQLQQVIEILHNFINIKDWSPPKEILHNLCESALLPLLESAFRSASLLDMAKEADLNQAYLKLTRAISHHRSLLPALLDLDPHYIPLQKDSIYTLLGHLKDLAQIFVNCLTAADKDASAPNQKLAQDIIETYKTVDASVQASHTFEESDGDEIFDILSHPLAESYRLLLQNLRFDYVSMKDANTNRFKHHYASYINNNTPPQSKMVRLAQELADLSNALPIEHTNSIFVRVDESRVDVMKALVMGASGTPYGHGAYEFDIYFDDAYPNAPPKVNLTTTGGAKVRFNPNLYSCGKVCLSLLGTWRGNASENWDPKLSTILQVLVSIQAIIMSEEIYFNEPGFEGEAGTEEGEKKNEAYSNIVRYCNIKYAMVDQMKNPPKGFETVIKRHFYLKKDEIMEEIRKWGKYAEHREAAYAGLVNDHNTNWCSEFKSSKNRYKDMLTEAIKELETELGKLQPPSGKDLKRKQTKKKEKKAEKVNINSGVANLEDIDVSYDKPGTINTKEMNIDDEGVKDRWSRYIGAMGIDAVTKQSNASIFLSGLGALGIEITKNIVLSGVKRFTIHDSKKTTNRDLSGQFFLGTEDLGKNRALASLPKIQQLNYYVKVDTALLDQKLPKDEEGLDKVLKGYTLVILIETDYETQIAVNNYCRKNKIYFISTDAFGPFSGVFSDFGDEFVVVDKNGEELQEVMLGSISSEEQGVVKLLQGHTHKYEDGDEVIVNGVEGMELIDKSQIEKDKNVPTSINGTKHKITTINASSFKIGDTTKYTPYQGNGLAKQIRLPISLKFQSLQQSLNEKIPFDPNMTMHDFLKINHPYILHIAFQTLDAFNKKHNRAPKPWDLPDSDEFITLASEVAKKVKDYNPAEDNRYEYILRRFSFTCQGVFAPLTAFLGGYVAQEAIKAITQKFMPTQQLFYTDCYEVIPDLPEKKEELETAIKSLGVAETNHRSDGLRICIGEKLLQDLAYSSLFMVGSGAIGCELLKNYAMLGVGTGEAGKNNRKEEGRIILTDPDVIEVSNLNRQFLFREKHLRKPKSSTAAAAALQMNKDLKGHVIARLDKVHEGTANIFTDKFFEDLTIVTNALDNVQARRYIDLRCVNAKTPLLESGTLGPKGHVQVIVPYKTESYSSQEDPKEEAEIPHCTLKMFPEEALHCVEWARDKFGKLFTQQPKGLAKALEDPNFEQIDSQEIKSIREALRLLQKRPTTFDDCIKYARQKFQKYFVNDIRQLLYTYPLDSKTKEGRPFWSLPKRPPHELTFDPKDLLHASLISAAACLRANIFGIPVPADARKEAGKLKMAEEAAKVKVADYQPSDEKAKAINSEVNKDANKQASNDESPEDDAKSDDIQVLIKEIKKLAANLPKDKAGKIMGCKAEEFEKDNDQNFHIDFIYSLANCRATNYKLEPMEWMTVKIKAGRIIPALATTTAAVAGLQTIELCKLIRNCKVEDMKNAFLSLAVPIMALSEPGPAPSTKLSDKLTVNIWDRWEIKLPRAGTLKNVFSKLEETYELVPKDVNYGSQTIYFHALMDIKGKEKEKEETLNTKLEELLNLEKDDKYADLTVMFARKGESEILKGVPMVRVTFE